MKPVHESGKRKTAIARATAKAGSGKVTINKVSVENITPILSRDRMLEPLVLAASEMKKIDISVSVNGGGIASQSDAARLAIAKAIVAYTKSKKVEQMFLDYDRQLLVADIRRKEVSKPNCQGKARSKRQKSYR